MPLIYPVFEAESRARSDRWPITSVSVLLRLAISAELAACNRSGRSSRAFSTRLEASPALESEVGFLGNRPSITAGAGLGFKNGLFTVDNTDLNALELNWNVGVALNVPIFDGFMTANRRAEAEGSLAAAKDEVEDLRRTIEAQVVQAIRSLAASRSRVENSADQLTETKQALNIARAQYTLGVITNLQYLDSQTSLELAKLNRLNALYKEALSEVDLEQAVGEDIWNKEGGER